MGEGDRRGERLSHDPYADLPALYDLEHETFHDDVDLYLRLAEVVGDPILELGCGSGRVLVPLAMAGHRVTGIDRSAAMLDQARAVVEETGVADRVTLIDAAMTDADRVAGAGFGLVLVSLNGLMHLTTATDQRRALAAARGALDPRGMLVIDTLNPTPDAFATFDGRVVHEGSWERADGTHVDRFSSRTHCPAEQLIGTELWYDLTDPSGAVRRVRSEFPMRYVTPAELELLLELTGFVEWKLYGSYDLDPFEDDSERLIITAEVTPS
jgi:SAM-dependent methyltransferase